MLKPVRLLLVILLSLLLSTAMVYPVFSNSAEPPSIIIIVPNAPEHLEISIKSDDGYLPARKTDKILETYYALYSHDLKNSYPYKLKISTKEQSFELILKDTLKYHNNIFRLDLRNHTLIPGKSLTRSITLVALRIILTLIIEGLIFLLFRYRSKRSWIIFLVINLLTQGYLNIWLNGFSPLTSYLILNLIFAEVLIFFVELMSFSILLKEHSTLRAVLYVLVANFLSLILGGYMISVLPI